MDKLERSYQIVDIGHILILPFCKQTKKSYILDIFQSEIFDKRMTSIHPQ